MLSKIKTLTNFNSFIVYKKYEFSIEIHAMKRMLGKFVIMMENMFVRNEAKKCND